MIPLSGVKVHIVAWPCQILYAYGVCLYRKYNERGRIVPRIAFLYRKRGVINQINQISCVEPIVPVYLML